MLKTSRFYETQINKHKLIIGGTLVEVSHSTLQSKSHDDYEYFAQYLGVDYDDYVELVGDFDCGEGEVEYEYELTV